MGGKQGGAGENGTITGKACPKGLYGTFCTVCTLWVLPFYLYIVGVHTILIYCLRVIYENPDATWNAFK